MKLNQKGFTIIEILIVIIVVGLLGTVCWLVYDRQKNSVDSNTTTQTSIEEQNKETATDENSTVDPYADWITYNDTVRNFGFKYPKDWTVDDSNVYGTYDQATNDIVGQDNIDILLLSQGATSQPGESGMTVSGGMAVSISAYKIAGVNGVKEAFGFSAIKNPKQLTIDNKEAYSSDDSTYSYFMYDDPYRISTEMYSDTTLPDEQSSYKSMYDLIVNSFRY